MHLPLIFPHEVCRKSNVAALQSDIKILLKNCSQYKWFQITRGSQNSKKMVEMDDFHILADLRFEKKVKPHYGGRQMFVQNQLPQANGEFEFWRQSSYQKVEFSFLVLKIDFSAVWFVTWTQYLSLAFCSHFRRQLSIFHREFFSAGGWWLPKWLSVISKMTFAPLKWWWS